jgi:hypothetical protein
MVMPRRMRCFRDHLMNGWSASESSGRADLGDEVVLGAAGQVDVALFEPLEELIATVTRCLVRWMSAWCSADAIVPCLARIHRWKPARWRSRGGRVRLVISSCRMYSIATRLPTPHRWTALDLGNLALVAGGLVTKPLGESR